MSTDEPFDDPLEDRLSAAFAEVSTRRADTTDVTAVLTDVVAAKKSRRPWIYTLPVLAAGATAALLAIVLSGGAQEVVIEEDPGLATQPSVAITTTTDEPDPADATTVDVTTPTTSLVPGDTAPGTTSQSPTTTASATTSTAASTTTAGPPTTPAPGEPFVPTPGSPEAIIGAWLTAAQAPGSYRGDCSFVQGAPGDLCSTASFDRDGETPDTWSYGIGELGADGRPSGEGYDATLFLSNATGQWQLVNAAAVVGAVNPDGSVVRQPSGEVIFRPEAPQSRPVSSITINRQNWFGVEGTGGSCDVRLLRTSGDTVVDEGPGINPRQSPSGRYLAYIILSPSSLFPDESCSAEWAVRDLFTDQIWRSGPVDPNNQQNQRISSSGEPVWDFPGDRFVFRYGWEDPEWDLVVVGAAGPTEVKPDIPATLDADIIATGVYAAGDDFFQVGFCRWTDTGFTGGVTIFGDDVQRDEIVMVDWSATGAYLGVHTEPRGADFGPADGCAGVR